MSRTPEQLESLLLHALAPLPAAIVAYSGGVDSSVVLRAAVLAIGADAVLAVTARSPSLPSAEWIDAPQIAGECGAAHRFLDTHELEDANYTANPANRCYFCKSELYHRLETLPMPRPGGRILNGANADDLGDHRPGLIAAAEHRVLAPLADAGFTKAEVRALAAHWGLRVHDKPASPCLASRVQYGEAITPEKLARIDRCETWLRRAGVPDCRVRHHGDLARVEAPIEWIGRLASSPMRDALDRFFREQGYRYVTIDLRGLRSGSMNEALLGPGLAAVRSGSLRE